MSRGARALLGAAALIGTPVALHLLFATHGAMIPRVVRLAYVAPWAGVLWVFARTLAPGREALVTAIARICRDRPLAPELERYTRHVTIAWCIFLAAMAAALAGLALAAPVETWSFFANIVAWPLLLAMFAIEYLYRRLRHGGHEHVPPLAMIQRLARAGWRLGDSSK
jgi:uncharacterized membrane protein